MSFKSHVLMILCLVFPFQFAQSQEYTLSISSSAALPGESIEVPVSIAAATKSIGAANLAITTAGALEVTSVLSGAALDMTVDFMDFDLAPTGMPVDMNGVLIGIIIDTAAPLAAPGPYEIAKLQIDVSGFAKPTLEGEINFSDFLSGALGASPNTVVEGAIPFTEFAAPDLAYQSGIITINTPPVGNLAVEITNVCDCSAKATWTNGFSYNEIQVWVDSAQVATFFDVMPEDGLEDSTLEPMPTSYDLGTTSTAVEVIGISNGQAAPGVTASVPACSPNPDDDGDGCPDCSSGSYDPNNDGTDTDSDGICDTGDSDIDGDGVPNDCDIDITGGEDCDMNGEDDSCQTDTDLDGTIDPCDGCPNDDTKTEAG
ncbi:MAG: hypothetical protein CBC13_06615, partial [Planctomycetia bacterium TMED53]